MRHQRGCFPQPQAIESCAVPISPAPCRFFAPSPGQNPAAVQVKLGALRSIDPLAGRACVELAAQTCTRSASVGIAGGLSQAPSRRGWDARAAARAPPHRWCSATTRKPSRQSARQRSASPVPRAASLSRLTIGLLARVMPAASVDSGSASSGSKHMF